MWLRHCLQQVDVAKLVGRVGPIRFAGQTGYKSKRVIFKQVSQVVGQSGRKLSRVTSQVELTRIFQTFFFFFEIDAICQLFGETLVLAF